MLILAVALAAASPSATSAVTATDASGVAAVTDAENAWSAAAVLGDAAFLRTFLADEYLSVGSDGVAKSKSDLVQHAEDVARRPQKATPMKLPPSSTVAVYGDLAIVRHRSATLVSVDILQRRTGRWMAVYSQHSQLPS